ncbi:hypothetical protein ACQJBY_048563 [Aegilops geniculata]
MGIPMLELTSPAALPLPRGLPTRSSPPPTCRRRCAALVKAAYEKRCEQLNKQGLEEEEISKEHDLLKESFTILSTEEERRLYDWSLARNGQPERYVWPFEVDPMELAPDPPKEPEDEFPTKLVGYFLLTWFIISVACSLILNRS